MVGLVAPWIRLSSVGSETSPSHQPTTRVTLSSGMAGPGLTAYGSVLRGVLEGDHTFGVRGDAAEQGWRIVDEVLAAFEDGRVPLLEYPAGSSGPV